MVKLLLSTFLLFFISYLPLKGQVAKKPISQTNQNKQIQTGELPSMYIILDEKTISPDAINKAIVSIKNIKGIEECVSSNQTHSLHITYSSSIHRGFETEIRQALEEVNLKGLGCLRSKGNNQASFRKSNALVSPIDSTQWYAKQGTDIENKLNWLKEYSPNNLDEIRLLEAKLNHIKLKQSN